MGEEGSKGGYANKDGGEKKEMTFKVFVNWEDNLIDFFSIHRVEPIEEYDEESSTGQKYGFLVRCATYPNEIKFFYGSHELRQKKFNEFKLKLYSCKAIIM